MNKALQWFAQGLLYLLFAATIAVFSRWPVYQHLAPDKALIKLSLSHQGKLLGDCETLSLDELAKLPPNMRAPIRCPRERAPLIVELDIDGVLVDRQIAEPSGLSHDGAATIYRRIEVGAGRHRIAVRLKDDARSEGFDYRREADVTLVPAEILVIDFDATLHEITMQ
ncbi:MAG: hypothetical protein CVU24_15565 [Betaproteobacteria bacterium HGW-Betaproteobacteria-18]|jgi:hypothetical protein|nr:MAG: hypothetical protein CVV12_00305 [Gammaproteobacteria bacterium HGW-Gammaproteobacteria-2]PKO59315.1 MAG: hypothetical protein CVU24_15565 [Betaproteobacteria bacterium HGW-Betaproteobacteria-18]